MLRRSVLVLIVVVGLAAIGILIGNLRLSRQELKACFCDVQGLKAGAGVRVAGVNVGRVRSVRANPQNKGCPAEVEMALATPYELHVPSDAIAAIDTEGVLGPRYVDIRVSQAVGPPIENFGYLKSKSHGPTASIEDHLKAIDLTLRLLDASIAAEKKESVPNSSPSAPKH